MFQSTITLKMAARDFLRRRYIACSNYESFNNFIGIQSVNVIHLGKKFVAPINSVIVY